MSIIDQILSVESGGDATAKNPRSTATGAGQFIDSTWLALIGRYRPTLTEGRSKADILALRNDPSLSRDMVEAYASENANILSNAGLPVTPATTYLAHFAGPQGAVSLLRADPTTPAGSVLGDAVARANPFMRDMTVGDLTAWAGQKMAEKPIPVSQIASRSEAPAAIIGSLGPAMDAVYPPATEIQQGMPGQGSSLPTQAFGSMEPEPLLRPPPLPDRRRPPQVKTKTLPQPRSIGWGFSL